ncbi:MAG: PEP-CTERM sorting domain-containing protein [Puniceicoccaceae bacterium]|nr:MAG: PEP-CTERM sorting domain-containing protein [Puniceicoccaceae bacterium]
MNKAIPLIFAGTLAFAAATAHSQIVYNTGLDSLGNKLTTAGQDDAHWMVIAEGTGNVTVPSATVTPLAQPFSAKFAIQNGNYNNTPTDAGWIWDTGASGSIPANRAVVFELTFDLTGYDVSGASLAGFWGVDNAGFIQLNGVTFSSLATPQGGDTATFKTFTPFAPTNLNSGLNSLQVTAINAGDTDNPAAVLVGGLEIIGLKEGAHPVPEPSTYGLIGALLLVGLIANRRLRQKTR